MKVNFDIKKFVHIRKDFSYEIGLPIMLRGGVGMPVSRLESDADCFA